MDDYIDKQKQRDAQYARAWETLTPAQRRQMAKHGITGPELPVYRTHKGDEESMLGKCSQPEGEPTSQSPQTFDCDMLDALRRILGELMAQDNIRLTLECLALVTGITYSGYSMTAIAKRHGVTRAAVSKRCVELTNALALAPSRAMKQLTARQAYERSTRHNHARLSH